MTILAPDGLRAAKAETIPMTLGQVQWFTNGHAFLRHVADLKNLRLSAVCVKCYSLGLKEEVTVLCQPEQMRYLARCAHLGERVIEAAAVKSTDELLLTQGWHLKCDHNCPMWGMADGVEGHNDTRADTVTITCGCTTRRYTLPPSTANRAVIH